MHTYEGILLKINILIFFVTKNLNFIKKRAYALIEKIEEEKTLSIIKKEQMKKEETKLYPIINAQTTLKSNSSKASRVSDQLLDENIQEKNANISSSPTPELNVGKTTKIIKKARHRPNAIDPTS